MNKWLLKQLFENQNQSDPKYALTGTIAWMRSLSILCSLQNFQNSFISGYNNLKTKNRNDSEKSIVYENLLFALHNISALTTFTNFNKNPFSIVRAAIISWYYSIYYSSKAMIAAVSGTKQETHSKTIRVFQNQLVDKNYICPPFHYSLKSIVPNDIDNEINILRKGNNNNLNRLPLNELEALGGIFSYLKGTAEFERDKKEKEIKKDKKFKDLNINNFRTLKARVLRDKILSKTQINFLSQSARFRGKANYRDSIYLSYGNVNLAELNDFILDMELVSQKYFTMSFALVSKCLKQIDVNNFVRDILKNARFDLDRNLVSQIKI